MTQKKNIFFRRVKTIGPETKSNNFSRKSIGSTIGISDYIQWLIFAIVWLAGVFESGLYSVAIRFTRVVSVSWAMRNTERAIRQAITMNALAEIFYIASGTGSAATPNIAVPTDADIYSAVSTPRLLKL